MKEITKEAFNACGIDRGVPSAAFVEKRWFESGKLIGVVVFDHDGEWGWVVLAEHPRRGYAAVDLGSSCRTVDEAIGQMSRSFASCADIDTGEAGPKVTREEAVRIMADVTGVSEERVRLGLEDFEKIPRPGNN